MRYGFLRVPSSNCEAPEVRNRSTVANGNGVAHKGTVRRKLLTKSKDDILLQPKKKSDLKMTAKELERTKKWRDMAIIDRTNGTIHYQFPFNKKVYNHSSEVDCSWCSERSREFLIVGELRYGMNFWIPKLQNSVIEKPSANS